MKYIYIVILICFSFSSCKSSFFYTDLYTRADRKSLFLLKSYSLEKDYCICKVKICYDLMPTSRLRTNGRIFFSRDSIQNSTIAAYKVGFPTIRSILLNGNAFDRNCDFQEKILSENFKSSTILDFAECCNTIIFPQLMINSKSLKNVYWGGPMGFSEDMGDDKHLLEYKLITSIYQNDTLIYKDNRTHWTEVFSERGEQLHYHVPKEVIENLVTLSLEEYFKRLK